MCELNKKNPGTHLLTTFFLHTFIVVSSTFFFWFMLIMEQDVFPLTFSGLPSGA